LQNHVNLDHLARSAAWLKVCLTTLQDFIDNAVRKGGGERESKLERTAAH
jgi:hypothetical protein